MGAMAISTLAGARVVGLADRSPWWRNSSLSSKGTLLFWATASWWIPVLLTLGAWRYIRRRYPLRYEHGYWSAVFPLGMRTPLPPKRWLKPWTYLSWPWCRPFSSGLPWPHWTLTFAGLVFDLAGQLRLDRSPKTEPTNHT